MRKRLLFFSICAFLSISSSLLAESREGIASERRATLGTVRGGDPSEMGGMSCGAANRVGGDNPPALMAALCEMEAWQAPDRATRDSLLLAKAEFLAEAGESARAYETVCRIQRFGLSEDQRSELLHRKLIYSWEAGQLDDFQVLLEEAGKTVSGKPRHRSTDAAMLLSIIPGAGLAYAGDWANAGKYFLLQGGSIALGVGAYLSGLYVSAFLGGGMLLYTTLPPATAKAVEAANDFNTRSLKDFYAPVVEVTR